MEHLNSRHNTTEDSERKIFRYKKRSGTSGITGQLYETKLLGLILCRARNDEEIQKFCLGTNLDNIGAFDDICFKFELNSKPVILFIQAKHRDEPQKGGITDADLINNKSDYFLRKYLESYLDIEEKIRSTNRTDLMFCTAFDVTELYLVIYTPELSKVTKKQYTQSNIMGNKIKKIISTCKDDNVFQIKYDDKDIDFLASSLIEKELNRIAEALINCIISDTGIKTTENDLQILKKYQSFLLSNITEHFQEEVHEWRINENILSTNNDYCIKFKEVLSTKLLLLKSTKTDVEVEDNLNRLTMNDLLETKYLHEVIGSIVNFNSTTNTLELLKKVPKNIEKYRQKIKELPISPAEAREALCEARKLAIVSARFDLSQIFSKSTEATTENRLVSEEQASNQNNFVEQKNIVLRFLQNLYFFTNEARQDEVEKLLKEELSKFNNDTVNKTRPIKVHDEAIYLNFYNKIQKWAMLPKRAYYLTQDCDYVEKSRNEILSNTYLATLNLICCNELNKYKINFENKAVKKLELNLNESNRVLNIVTRAQLLTSIKLSQFLENYSFIDIDFLINISFHELQIILEELKTANVDILIIITNTKSTERMTWEFINNIVNRFSKKVVVLSDYGLSMHLEVNFDILLDSQINFSDLTKECQDHWFACGKITAQGHQVSLGSIVDCESKSFIEEDVLLMLMRNENMVIGKKLIDDKYTSICKFYIKRCLKQGAFEYEVKNLKDFVKSVVVITAEPDMGKSTFLSHLSLETKKVCPSAWIMRVNLLDYCSQFSKWKNEQKCIDLKDTMTLLCKAELENADDSFELTVMDGKLELKQCELKGTALLQLKIMIYSYNNGDMIFIFDGFDEICPHYKKEAVEFMKNVVPKKDSNVDALISSDKDDDGDSDNPLYKRRSNLIPFHELYTRNALVVNPCHTDLFRKRKQNKIWIASRTYDSIKQILETEFGESHQLQPWSVEDGKTFCHKYLESNINFDALSTEQFKNIEGFLKFMSQYKNENTYHQICMQSNIAVRLKCNPLYHIYEFSHNYISDAISHTFCDIPADKLSNILPRYHNIHATIAFPHANCFGFSKTDKICGTPLQMYIAANYFVNSIIQTDQKNPNEKWDLNINTYKYYEIFVETKFKTIRLEDKNRRYTCCPDEIIAYEKEKKDFSESHKKLAFYSLFYHLNDLVKYLPENKYFVIKEKIRQIENGEEKTGLIHRIHNNVPIFGDPVIADFFAIEYISDCIKRASNGSKRRLLDFVAFRVLYVSNGLTSAFSHKLRCDEELTKAVSGDSYYVMRRLDFLRSRMENDLEAAQLLLLLMKTNYTFQATSEGKNFLFEAVNLPHGVSIYYLR